MHGIHSHTGIRCPRKTTEMCPPLLAKADTYVCSIYESEDDWGGRCVILINIFLSMLACHHNACALYHSLPPLPSSLPPFTQVTLGLKRVPPHLHYVTKCHKCSPLPYLPQPNSAIAMGSRIAVMARITRTPFSDQSLSRVLCQGKIYRWSSMSRNHIVVDALMIYIYAYMQSTYYAYIYVKTNETEREVHV
jgi:hypothetical protein